MKTKYIKLIINEDIVPWIVQDFNKNDFINMLEDIRYLSEDRKKEYDFRSEVFSMLGDFMPITFIDNWKEVKVQLNKTTYKGMPLGDYYENELEIRYGDHPEHIDFDPVGAWWKEVNDE